MLYYSSNGAIHQATPKVSHTAQEERSNKDKLDDLQKGNGNKATATHEGEANEDELLSNCSN